MCRVEPNSDGAPALGPEAEAVLNAAIDLFVRCGASEFNFGYLHEDVPPEDADWYAYVGFRGSRITVEHERGPVEALDALAARVLDGGMCTTCHRINTTSPDGVVVRDTVNVHDGSKMSQDQAAANVRRNGACHWVRDGERWYSGCDPHVRPKPRTPEGDDELHSTEKLARALEELDDPARFHLADRARLGYYGGYLSPHTFPQLELVKDLRELGLDDFAERVMNDEFDESPAESLAWSQSEEGREAEAELRASGRYDELRQQFDNFATAFANLPPDRRAAMEQAAKAQALAYPGFSPAPASPGMDLSTEDRSRAARSKRKRKKK